MREKKLGGKWVQEDTLVSHRSFTVSAEWNRQDGDDEESYERILKDDEIDVIDIVLPVTLMPRFVEKALRFGKHVISEKPVLPRFGVSGKPGTGNIESIEKAQTVLQQRFPEISKRIFQGTSGTAEKVSGTPSSGFVSASEAREFRRINTNSEGRLAVWTVSENWRFDLGWCMKCRFGTPFCDSNGLGLHL